ncbi:cell wall-active antibiotics response protein LiaF [Evansella tamaricis]|uniref:Cell wall-active antibiotics response protein n=1 Tax=Evansella tamaricis TaxID=2069301 RepID=A0ABS6JI41_9BACI|nr:cell wall-active antibiotics response protein LiaF [Evansella tamaricis]MBU9713261.1 cell wall-active antibiotics response protein [Evansella tamaricis]
MKNIFGILILAIGVIFLLTNTGLIDSEATSIVSTFWPILIILIGLKVLFEGFVIFLQSLKRDRWHVGKFIWGVLITAVGTVILGNNAGWFTFSVSDLWSWVWPVLVIYIGFKVIFDRDSNVVIHLGGDNEKGKKKNLNHDFSSSGSHSYKNKSFRNKRKRYHSWVGEIQLGRQPFEIDGADISLWIGDVTVDLSKAILKEGENFIDVRCWIGSVDILVPKDMAVKAVADVNLGEVTLFDDSYSGTGKNATYTSPNFHEAEQKVILVVNLNIGDVEVLTVG